MVGFPAVRATGQSQLASLFFQKRAVATGTVQMASLQGFRANCAQIPARPAFRRVNFRYGTLARGCDTLVDDGSSSRRAATTDYAAPTGCVINNTGGWRVNANAHGRNRLIRSCPRTGFAQAGNSQLEIHAEKP